MHRKTGKKGKKWQEFMSICKKLSGKVVLADDSRKVRVTFFASEIRRLFSSASLQCDSMLELCSCAFHGISGESKSVINCEEYLAACVFPRLCLLLLSYLSLLIKFLFLLSHCHRHCKQSECSRFHIKLRGWNFNLSNRCKYFSIFRTLLYQYSLSYIY